MSTLSRIVKFLLLSLLAILVVGYVFLVGKDYLIGIEAEKSPVETTLSDLDADEPLTGRLYVTAVTREQFDEVNDTDSGAIPTPESYVFNLESSKWDVTFTNYPAWFVSGNSAMGQHVFVTLAYDAGENNVPTVFLIDGNINLLKISNLQGLPSDLIRRLPKISQNGAYYVNSVANQADDTSNINNWSVNIGSTDGMRDDRYLADGYGAVWAGNSHILYVKSDGVYVKEFSATTNEEGAEFRLIAISESALGLQHQIDVSANGSYLAVAFPVDPRNGNSKVVLYQLSLNEGLNPSATALKTISTTTGEPLHWPTFSPGGRYLAMIGGYSGDEDDNRLYIYDISQQSFVEDYSFSDFAINYSFMSDWLR